MNLLLGNSPAWTILFFVLTFLAVLTEHTITKPVPYALRALVKAAPAFFLAGLSWYLHGPPLLTLAFLLCACGDVLLRLAKHGFSSAFEFGAIVFAVALICLSFTYLAKPLPGRPLLPLVLPNIVLALFVCVWVFPKIKGRLRILGVSYLAVLLISNVIAATSVVPVFLGSTLWYLSDLAIGVGRYVPGTPSNGPTNLALYDLGLYFLALGLLIS